jgi:hypothetical protein
MGDHHTKVPFQFKSWMFLWVAINSIHKQLDMFRVSIQTLPRMMIQDQRTLKIIMTILSFLKRTWAHSLQT